MKASILNRCLTVGAVGKNSFGHRKKYDTMIWPGWIALVDSGQIHSMYILP